MWILDINDANEAAQYTEPFVIRARGARGIVTVATIHAYPEDESSEGITFSQASHNARIISYAPEMFEILKMVCAHADGELKTSSEDLYKRIRFITANL